ncbi:MAG: MATE family efflux transporter [Oscillospiraceae bacterium]|nr:MATE family efflux transporter [Oscillospiraceae bacterium]
MSRAEKYSLVEGSIVNKLFFVAGPIIVTQIFQMAYNLTDMFWLGRLSSDAVAASGTAGMFLWLSMAFFLFGRMGAEIGVSQNLGRKDIETARAFAQNAIIIAIICGVFIGAVFMIFHNELLGLFQIREAHVEREAAEYLAIVSISLPIGFMTAAINGIFVGAGNSRMSMMVSGFGFILNMVLDPILIFTAGLGIHGAAIATVIAQSLTVCLAIYVLLKSKDRPFEKMRLTLKPNFDIIKQIAKWVTPVSLESFLFTVLSMMLTPLVANYGAGALATVRIGSQIESLTWLIAGGYAAALTAFTGQNFGAGKWTRINKGFKISTGLMICWGILIALVLFFGGGVLFGIFIPNEPDVIKMGIHYLQVLAFVQVPACLEGVAAGIFRGKGKTLPPSIASISSNIMRVLFAYLFVSFTDLGLTGIWIAVGASAAIRGTWIFIWYTVHSRKEPKTDVEIITDISE